jgi:hypothetical protein
VKALILKWILFLASAEVAPNQGILPSVPQNASGMQLRTLKNCLEVMESTSERIAG